MPWPLGRRIPQVEHHRTYLQAIAASAQGGGTPSGRSYVRDVVYSPPLRLSDTPDAVVARTFGNENWVNDAVAKPVKTSHKKHSAIGKTLKKWHGLSAASDARRAHSGAYMPYVSHCSEDLSTIFAGLPESRRRGVSDALRSWSKEPGDLERSTRLVRTVATLLARRAPEVLQRDARSAKRLSELWPTSELHVLPAILVWLESVPAKEHDASVDELHAFLLGASNRITSPNAFFRALTAIGAKNQHHALKQLTKLAGSYDWASPHTLLITALARIPHAERSLFVQQTRRAMSQPNIGHPLAVPALLSDMPACEREELATALGEFYTALTPVSSPGQSTYEFLADLKKLPHARRALYLESLAGAHVAARKPTYRPNEVAVTALWLYYGLIDHRYGMSDVMELHLSNTLCAFMALEDPAAEAPALVRHAKALVGADGSASALEAVATTLTTVPQEHRARFTSLVKELCRELPESDPSRIASLLAHHPPQGWTTLVEACQPLRESGLYPALVSEGMKVVLSMSTPASAADVCATFLQGGLAKAAQQQPRPATTQSDQAPVVVGGSGGSVIAPDYDRASIFG